MQEIIRNLNGSRSSLSSEKVYQLTLAAEVHGYMQTNMNKSYIPKIYLKERKTRPRTRLSEYTSITVFYSGLLHGNKAITALERSCVITPASLVNQNSRCFLLANL